MPLRRRGTSDHPPALRPRGGPYPVRLPRDLTGEELVQRLARLGYRVERQTGSHVRMTWEGPSGPHAITIPLHRPLRVGTLAGILKAVAEARGIDRKELQQPLDL
ncbi:type II toxin-antitoxin system HicA family toxin [Thermus thermophilus]|uniref:type II toxin-antitoxin system HicA family toxin n=1 Tax=Thermus thermophilus TaxID=274 RepID=UPI00286ED7F9|nr:type II toxin-antitoxin system HicA family toxin [Thermus thermophilus]